MRGVAQSFYSNVGAFALLLAGVAGCDSVSGKSDGRDTQHSTVVDDINDPAVADADGDGIADAADLCPQTPSVAEVDSNGCSCSQRDSDNDGVDDCTDECPNNPALAKTSANISFVVTFADPTRAYTEYYDNLSLMVEAAGAAWASNLAPLRDVSIEVEIQFADIVTAHGGSAVSALVAREGGIDLYEQGVASEIRTGRDPNGGDPDATITVGINNLLHGAWWFDPDPANRSTEVPADQLDAFSTILHELGHVLAYNGWRRQVDGSAPDGYQSTYDQHEIFDGQIVYFAGPQATFVHGGPVPLTYSNICHVANRAPRPGDDLLDELMNGVADHRGWRRWISELDRAILADVGLPVRLRNSSGSACELQLLGQPAAGRRVPVTLGPPTTPQAAGRAAPAVRSMPPVQE
jgi:hypothetical protein